MKTKVEKVAEIICILSIVAVVIGLLAGILYLNLKISYLDTIACYGFTLFVLPILALQIAIPANIGQYGAKNMSHIFLILLFSVIFPFVDAWFFCWN
ncbi:MAG: hypothetical protein EOM85_00010 [Candidatus Moranbacteria bacterium]|nr:hypothetical protein [Candidatus Moranbacteria bacterium]